MKRIFCFFAVLVMLFILTGLLYSQVNQLWVARYNGPGNFYDQANSITVDGSGNIYVTGDSWGIGTGKDISTIKYDANGVLQWIQRYNGPGNGEERIYKIVNDNSGNVYVSGMSKAVQDQYDYVIIKYDTDGNIVWIRRYHGPGNGGYDRAFNITVDGSGNVFVTGTSYGGGPVWYDYATIKYDVNGNIQWVQRYNGPGSHDEEPYKIVVDGSGNVYVTGYSTGDGTGNDYATIKYNSSGVQQWVARYNGPGNGSDVSYSLAVDENGNVYITGSSPGLGTMSEYERNDYATIKYDANGNEQWVQRYNGPGNSVDRAYSLVLNELEGVYVTGYSQKAGTGNDIATIKYDENGNMLWTQRYTGVLNGTDIAYSVVTDNSGSIYVCGYSNSQLIGYNSDYVTVKYNSSGVQQWAALYNGPGNDTDRSGPIAVDSYGNIYVTGGSVGIGTSFDFATIKYSECNVSVSAGNDAEIYLGYGPQSVQLTATPSGGYEPYTYLWTPGGVTTQTIDVSPTTTTSYIVQINDIYQCAAIDTVTVYVYNTTCGNNGNKILICHNGHTICVAPEAVPAHLAHGDKLDSCEHTPDVMQNSLPTEFKLYANYPNPFNPVTTIKFDLPENANTKLVIFDILGREVSVLVNGNLKAGSYLIDWNANDFPSGIYFYRIETKDFVATKKMLLIK